MKLGIFVSLLTFFIVFCVFVRADVYVGDAEMDIRRLHLATVIAVERDLSISWNGRKSSTRTRTVCLNCNYPQKLDSRIRDLFD